jgi:thioredoxin 1
MKGTHRVLAIAALACAVGVVFVMKRDRSQQESEPETAPARTAVTVTHEGTVAPREAPRDEALPRLVDLGAGKCIPCKMMAPILEELSKECADTFEVKFIDVWENPKAGEEYGIRMIPTQIFYDSTGKELFRHEGFFGKEEILAKWKEYGVTVAAESGE